MSAVLRAGGKRRVWFSAALVLSGLFTAGRLAAQDRLCASPSVGTAHWARSAIERLIDAGVIRESGFDLGSRSLPHADLALAFRQAARQAVLERSPYARLALGYALRFAEQFHRPLDARDLSISVTSELAYHRVQGDVRSGTGYDNINDWTGVVPSRTISEPAAGGVLSITSPYCVGGRFSAYVVPEGLVVREAYLVAEQWKLVGWVGRRALGYGQSGEATGIVLRGTHDMDGFGGALAERVYLPGPLRLLGKVHLESFFARIQNNGDTRLGGFEHPWMWGARGSVTPHPRVTIGLNRAAMFGGEGNSPVTAGNLAKMIFTGNLRDSAGVVSIGSGAFSNQLLSMDIRVRPPLGAIPLVLYAEAGMDDGSGAWRDVPGVRAGVSLAAVPGIPELKLGLERTSFAHSCCGNSAWYRNWSFRGGWADDGVPLGHPLGGQGVEWRLIAQLDALDTRLRVGGQAFRRERGPESLYAPEREGISNGVTWALEFKPRRDVELFVRGTFEEGERSWSETRLNVGGRLYFALTVQD
jgi:hypothetical protein